MKITSTVGSADAGRKIKYYIRGTLGISYHMFSVLKANNAMLVNGVPVHANYILCEGDQISLEIEDRDLPVKSVAPEDHPVNIVYQDEDLMIIDKDAPLACQCSERNPSGTLENRIAAMFPDIVFRPLNRLDKGTSGLMCAAKHAHSCQLLQKQLHTDTFVREYTAIVEGIMTGSGTIDLPISKAPEASIRRVIDHENGQQAVTHYECIGTDGRRTIVRLRLETGRTHQIRVHLSSMGHPITGDFLYGTETDELPGRFALHSSHIQLNHPLSGETIDLFSPLPACLSELCRI